MVKPAGDVQQRGVRRFDSHVRGGSARSTRPSLRRARRRTRATRGGRADFTRRHARAKRLTRGAHHQRERDRLEVERGGVIRRRQDGVRCREARDRVERRVDRFAREIHRHAFPDERRPFRRIVAGAFESVLQRVLGEVGRRPSNLPRARLAIADRLAFVRLRARVIDLEDGSVRERVEPEGARIEARAEQDELRAPRARLARDDVVNRARAHRQVTREIARHAREPAEHDTAHARRALRRVDHRAVHERQELGGERIAHDRRVVQVGEPAQRRDPHRRLAR